MVVPLAGLPVTSPTTAAISSTALSIPTARPSATWTIPSITWPSTSRSIATTRASATGSIAAVATAIPAAIRIAALLRHHRNSASRSRRGSRVQIRSLDTHRRAIRAAIGAAASAAIASMSMMPVLSMLAVMPVVLLVMMLVFALATPFVAASVAGSASGFTVARRANLDRIGKVLPKSIVTDTAINNFRRGRLYLLVDLDPHPNLVANLSNRENLRLEAPDF
jgi:hypothetical protein